MKRSRKAKLPVDTLRITTLDESSGRCDCCGKESRCVWGLVDDEDGPLAAYWMHWTEGHLEETGANLDLALGQWGEGTSPADRFSVSLLYRQQADGSNGMMVIDATDRVDDIVVRTALARHEVIGAPLAAQVFTIVDAIFDQDRRFF